MRPAPGRRNAGGLAWHALALLVALVSLADHSQAQLASGFDFDRSPDAVVLRFVESAGELASNEGRRSLVLYGDGRLVVEQPRAMIAGGRHESRLDEAGMRALLGSMRDRGVPRFDATRVRASLAASRAARRGPPLLFASSDPSVIELEIALAEGGAAPQTRQLRWVGLRADRKRHPEQRELEALDRACTELRAMIREKATAAMAAGR